MMMLAQPIPSASHQVRLLKRSTFGPTPALSRTIQETGTKEWLSNQLYETAAAPVLPASNQLDTIYNLPLERLREVDAKLCTQSLVSHTIRQAVESPLQLQEILVRFWSDHFNISVKKRGRVMPILKLVDDRDVIRPNARRTFTSLLTASAYSPAMLLYLDNVQNFKGSPNENYARELLELHSLGIDGGYSHNDIDEVARIFTGWNFFRQLEVKEFGTLRMRTRQHDGGQKRVLGHTFHGNGERDIVDLLDRVGSHPSTYNHLAFKLVRRFVADDPPSRLVIQIASKLNQSGGDIPQAIQTIFESADFANAPARFKRPFHFITSTCRALEAKVEPTNELGNWLQQLGQPLFQWPFPDGYPDVATAWTDKLLPRWNFAIKLARDEIKGVSIEWDRIVNGSQENRIEMLAMRLFGQRLDQESLSFIVQYLQHKQLKKHSDKAWQEIIAIFLCSPAFQWT